MTQEGISIGANLSSNTEKSERNPSFHQEYLKYATGLSSVLERVDPQVLEEFCAAIATTRKHRGKIIFFGNGGSASTASHAAADLSKQRFEDEALLFRAISLTDNNATITAAGNDFGFDRVFEQQLKIVLEEKDLVVAISSSGNSANIIKGIEYANSRNVQTWGICGFDGGKLKEQAQHVVHIPTKLGQYGFHEDASMAIIHAVSIFLYEADLKIKIKTEGQLKNALAQPITKIIEDCNI